MNLPRIWHLLFFTSDLFSFYAIIDVQYHVYNGAKKYEHAKIVIK